MVLAFKSTCETRRPNSSDFLKPKLYATASRAHNQPYTPSVASRMIVLEQSMEVPSDQELNVGLCEDCGKVTASVVTTLLPLALALVLGDITCQQGATGAEGVAAQESALVCPLCRYPAALGPGPQWGEPIVWHPF